MILVHGYRGSYLYDSGDNYSNQWPEFVELRPGDAARAASNLNLPLTWNASSLTQDMTDVGPERFDGDDTPSLFQEDETLIPILNEVRAGARMHGKAGVRQPCASPLRRCHHPAVRIILNVNSCPQAHAEGTLCASRCAAESRTDR